MVRDFVTKHLYGKPGVPAYERIYQVSQRVLSNDASEGCMRMIKRLLKRFVSDAVRTFSKLEAGDVGEGLYGFEHHWSRSEHLFGKVFHPILSHESGHGKVFVRLFSRLFNRFIDKSEKLISNYILSSISKEMFGMGNKASIEDDMKRVREFLASDDGDYGTLKKPRIGNRRLEIECRPRSHIFTSDRFKSLSASERISVLTSLLRKRGCFGSFFEGILEYLVSVYKSEIEYRELGLCEIQELMNEQRETEYLKDEFYIVESRLMRELVRGFEDEYVFKMFKDKEEMELCVRFFFIANEEDRLLEIIRGYHERMSRKLSVANFLFGYYLIDLEFRVICSRGDEKYKRVRETIEQCKSKIINSDTQVSIEGICKWVDALLRGRITIDRKRICWPEDQCEEMSELSTRRILENIGVDGIFPEGKIWEEYILSDIFRVVGEVLYLCDGKDLLKQLLREGLANRLLSRSYVSLDREQLLANAMDVGRIHSHKMRCMLKDFSEREVFMNSEILFLRMCKWPEYKDVDLVIPDLKKIRKRYEECALKNQKKRVRWMNILSSCELEVLGIPVTVTLVQYYMLMLLKEKPVKVEDMNVCEFWDVHLEILVRNGLVVVENDHYLLDTGWEVGSIKVPFVPESFSVLNVSEASKAFDESESLKNVLDCKIIRTMKYNKVLSKKELRRLVGGCSEEVFDEEVESLVKRDFLAVEDGNIKYLP